MNMQERAVQAGFKGAMGSKQVGYILLSELTDGRAGRRIYIQPDLAPKFVAMVEESRQNHVLSQLAQLRALAGGSTSYSNLANAREHKTQLGELTVTYTITQQVTDGLQPGVYISDIDGPLFGKENLPGLYKVERRLNRWAVDHDYESKEISTTNASINGLSDNLHRAAEEIMPPMIEYAYGQVGANRNQLYKEGFTHFYYPQSIRIDGNTWKTPEQKLTNHTFCASKLAKALVHTQARNRKVQWTIHGSGSNLLKTALQQLQGKNLDQHEVMLMAPEPISELLPLMQRTGMSLHPDVMKYSDSEVSTRKQRNTLWDAKKIALELRRFGNRYENQAEQLHYTARRKKFIKGGKLLLTAGTLGASNIGQAALSLSDHSLRNTAASLGNVMDKGVNPHLNPHLSADDLNFQAKKQAGGVLKSYRTTFKELIKKVRSV